MSACAPPRHVHENNVDFRHSSAERCCHAFRNAGYFVQRGKIYHSHTPPVRMGPLPRRAALRVPAGQSDGVGESSSPRSTARTTNSPRLRHRRLQHRLAREKTRQAVLPRRRFPQAPCRGTSRASLSTGSAREHQAPAVPQADMNDIRRRRPYSAPGKRPSADARIGPLEGSRAGVPRHHRLPT